MSEDIVVIAPNGRWSARQQTGIPAVNGFVFTFENQTRTPKATYQDPAKTTLNTNPIRLDSKGEANIYWDITDTYYTIEVYAANPSIPHFPGELLYSQNNYPYVNGSGGGNVIINSLANNIVRNSQFTFWGNKGYLKALGETPQDVYTRLGINEVICDDFILERNNDSSNIQISRGTFFAGQTDVPGSPVNYLHYESDTTGSGELYKAVIQKYQSADTFSGQEVSIGLYAKSATSSSILIYITQNFGTGGGASDEVITPVFTQVLTTDWALYSGTVTLPSVAGKTYGTNGDSYIKLSIGMPLNAIANIDIANLQFHGQNTLPDFPYITINDQYKRLDAVVNETAATTGQYMLTLDDAEKEGWILCDDETIGNYYSNATHVGNKYLQLFVLIWNKASNALAPIYDDAGVLTVRGASAIDDWNDDKQLNLTRVLGRTFGAKGQPTMFQEFVEEELTPEEFTVIDYFDDNLILAGATSAQTGDVVTLTTTGTLPAPLATFTSYYLIVIDSTTVKLASSLGNAYAGIPIDITSAGTGTQTMLYLLLGSTTFTVQHSRQFVVTSTADLHTGQTVELKTTGALPAPLTINTVYYVINVDATTFRLASTFEYAEEGTPILITTAGTGTHTVHDDSLLIVGDAYSYYTGTPVILTTDGALPTPLLADVTYYSIYVAQNTFELASSYSNAIKGIAIPLTTEGNGLHVATIQYGMTLINGQAVGEFAHGQTPAELAEHRHTYLKSTAAGPKPASSGTTPFENYVTDNTSSAGDSIQANVIQPSFYTNCFLKL